MVYRAPGLLRRDVDPDVIMMLCTAGHVDHGKTSLVKLLTGCNTDRLKIEQERGMTIELGFAPCYMGGNLCVGIVDVPGHEKFIHNMVAGVSGIDLALLVIAADDGVMPQTIEHLQIMELLGVRRGIVALTKIDLATPERVAQVTEEINEFLQGTFMAGAPVCPVSSETFEGYDEFYLTLTRAIKTLSRRVQAGIFRMPVERVFVRQGFGVVVTGIPTSGAAKVGEAVELVPGGMTGKVRSIQRFLRDAGEGGAGQCLAFNIPDFAKKPPTRGQVICRPGYVSAARALHVRARLVSGLEQPLRNAEAIKFHTGTMEADGKIYLLEATRAGEGETALATIVLNEPVAVCRRDRFILRRPSPPSTIAGGEVLAVDSGAERPAKKVVAERLRRYLDFFADVEPGSMEDTLRLVEYALLEDRPLGASLTELARLALLPPEETRAALSELVDHKKALSLGNDVFVHAKRYCAAFDDVAAFVRQAAQEGKTLSLSAGELRQGREWPEPLWRRIDEQLAAEGLGTWRNARLVLREAAQRVDTAEGALIAKLLNIYEETGYLSPRPDELPEKLGAPQAKIDRLLEHLYNEGKLIRLARNVVLTRRHYKDAQDNVVGIIKAKGTLNSSDFKAIISSSRKYALALLDHLDARRVTIRIGNDRKLTRDYEKYLI